MRHINNIVLHCTANWMSFAELEDYFTSVKEWKHPGYHVAIAPNGSSKILLPYDKVANGVRGHNDDAIHLATISGVDRNTGKIKDTRTTYQILKLEIEIYRALSFLQNYQDIKDVKIVGHRDFSYDKNGNEIIDPWERNKECPCYNAMQEYGWITNTKGLPT